MNIEPTSFTIQESRQETLDRRIKNSVHKLRIEHLNNQTKVIKDIQAARLDALDARTKNNVHKLRLEHLNNQTKAVENIQAARLDALDARTKTVDNTRKHVWTH